MADYEPGRAAEILMSIVRGVVKQADTSGRATSTTSSPTGSFGPEATGSGPEGVSWTGGYTGNQSQDDFYKALLKKLNLPVSPANLQLMRAWNQAEGMDAGYYNPFATTQAGAGRNINSVGVKAYSSFEAGVNATAQTLTNGLYGGILDGLRRSDPVATAQAIANSPWGTGSLVSRILTGTPIESSLPLGETPAEGDPNPPSAGQTLDELGIVL